MIRLLWSLFLSVLLFGCGSGNHEDIREWMKENSKDLRGKVQTLPEIKPPPVLDYNPGDLASPFSTDKIFAADIVAGSGRIGLPSGGPKPLNPDAYPMTKYPLEAIRFLGTIVVNKELRALVAGDRDPVRQVRVGDYLGQNFGKVVQIEPPKDDSLGRILLKETVLDKGIWTERDARLPPQDKGDKK